MSGRFYLPDRAIDQGIIGSLSGNAVKILLALIRHVDATGFCWPSVSLLATEARVSRSTAFARLDELIAANLVSRESRAGRAGYLITFEAGHERRPQSENPDSQSENPDSQSENPDSQSENPDSTVRESGLNSPRIRTRKETQEGRTRRTHTLNASFDAFWGVVHYKTGKKAAEKAFDKSVKTVASDKRIPSTAAAEFIIERMTEFSKSPRAKPPDRTPVHPTTWLNAGMYDDDPQTWGIHAVPTDEASAFRAELAAANPVICRTEVTA